MEVTPANQIVIPCGPPFEAPTRNTRLPVHAFFYRSVREGCLRRLTYRMDMGTVEVFEKHLTMWNLNALPTV